MSENNEYRADFPLLSLPEYKDLIYFDNAATTQRPSIVLEAIQTFYKKSNANPLRGLYKLSAFATESLENSRHTVASFIGASDCEVVFTRNTTESLNALMFSYAWQTVNEGDNIVISIMEHHSNLVPWQYLCREKNAELIYLECDKNTFTFPESELQKINTRTRIVSITQTSNVLGITNDIKKIAEVAHKVGAVCIVDAAQSVPHRVVNVKELGADFLAFSAHKVCGPLGIGVLYGRKSLLEGMPPFLRGGEMIEYVTRKEATWAPIPQKFEAGTVDVAGAVGLASAIEYVSKIGLTNIEKHDTYLTSLLLKGLKTLPYIHIIGSEDPTLHSGIVTFTIDGVHSHDAASLLDTKGVAIRAGHHCTQPLGKYLGVSNSCRASVYLYNTEGEVYKFIDSIKQVRLWMGIKD